MNPRSGQAMLIAILTLGGAILGATALAGFLLLYQIRSTTDSQDSARAIFAADAGVNWALYSYFNTPTQGGQTTQPGFASGATVDTTCYNATGQALQFCDDADNLAATSPATTSYAIAEGLSGGTRRAFLVELSSATGTFP